MGEPVGVESPLTSFGGPGGINGHDSTADSSFHPYPPTRPFINTDYQRPATKPIMAFPQSNRDGVLSALRSLQEKMQKLEFERQEAETNLHALASDTETYKNSLHSPKHRQRGDANAFQPSTSQHSAPGDNHLGHSATGNLRMPPRELESQLSTAETRCQLLEKQLDYMRRMVQTAEQDRTEAVHKAEMMQQQHTTHRPPSPLAPDYRAQLDRIGELERDHLRLTATQTLAESKIKELENKLKEEREHRRVLQERALDLESAAVSHQILLNSDPGVEKRGGGGGAPLVNGKCKKSAISSKKKKKKVVSTKKQIPVKSEPTKHYRLNLAEIPFVAGKSTGPSHAVGANVQKVLAMMKSHNLALCSSLYNGHHHGGGYGGDGVRSDSPSLSSTSSVSLDQDLADLLAQLQDEFGQLSFEHQEYMRQIHEARDSRLREDLERELDALVIKMEAKGQQISKVRQHQEKLEDAKRQSKRASKRSAEHVPRPSSAMGRLQAGGQGHKHTHAHSSGNMRPKSSSRHGDRDKCQDLAHPSLNVLKDMRKLQSTLRRDDLCWE